MCEPIRQAMHPYLGEKETLRRGEEMNHGNQIRVACALAGAVLEMSCGEVKRRFQKISQFSRCVAFS